MEDTCVKKPMHKHILVRAMVKNPPQDEPSVILWLAGLVEFLGMKVVKGPFASYIDVRGNRGMTAAVMIETSHIAFHVWDEQDPSLLQFDIYTCGSLDTEGVLKQINKFFECESYEYIVYDREYLFKKVDSGKRVIN
jgi:S-adenosylmethionine/arginine decarboxylase-like enzyme